MTVTQMWYVCWVELCPRELSLGVCTLSWSHTWHVWSMACRMGSPAGEYKAPLTLIHNTGSGRGQRSGKCESLMRVALPHPSCQAAAETLAQCSNSVLVLVTSAADKHSDCRSVGLSDVGSLFSFPLGNPIGKPCAFLRPGQTCRAGGRYSWECRLATRPYCGAVGPFQ